MNKYESFTFSCYENYCTFPSTLIELAVLTNAPSWKLAVIWRYCVKYSQIHSLLGRLSLITTQMTCFTLLQ